MYYLKMIPRSVN